MRLLFVARHTTDDAMLVGLLQERATLNLGKQHSVESGAQTENSQSVCVTIEIHYVDSVKRTRPNLPNRAEF